MGRPRKPVPPPVPLPEVSKDMCVSDALDVWLAYFDHGRKPASNATMRARALNFRRLYGSQPIAEINRDDIAEFYRLMLDTFGLKPHVAMARIQMLKGFFQFFHEDGIVAINPVQQNRLPKVPTWKEKKVPFNLDGFRAVANKLGDRYEGAWRTACTVGYYTGLRFSDVCFLRWAPDEMGHGTYVDFDRELVIARPIKRDQTNQVLEIPMERELYDELLVAWNRRPEHYMANPYVMPVMHGFYVGQRTILCNQFRIACDAVGLPEHSFHSFRHGFVTRLLNAGVDTLIISSMTGQSRDQIAQYAHVSQDAKRKALDRAREALHRVHVEELRAEIKPEVVNE